MLRAVRKYGAFCGMVAFGCSLYILFRLWRAQTPEDDPATRFHPKHVPGMHNIKDEEKVNSVIRQAHALQRAGVGAPLLGAGVLAGAVALADDVAGLAPRRTDRVHVCFTSDKHTVMGLIALMNSIRRNSRSHVKYHVLVEKDILQDVKTWIEQTDLRNVDYVLKAFDDSQLAGSIKVRGSRQDLANPMTYARFFYLDYFPDLRNERFIHIDDDCIVQGDVVELRDSVKLGADHVAAFSDDCSTPGKRFSFIPNNYASYLNFRSARIQRLGIKPLACSFSAGVYVADATRWRRHNVTTQLLRWMNLNTKEDIYGGEKGGGGAQPPLMIVLYNKYVRFPPMWNVRYLGWRAGNHYSKSYISGAKLLHWNGRFKPWGGVTQLADVWDKYFIPDPQKKYLPVRKSRRKS